MGHALDSIKGPKLKFFKIPGWMSNVHLSLNLIWTVLWKKREAQMSVCAHQRHHLFLKKKRKKGKERNRMVLFKSFHRLPCGNPVNEFLRCLEIMWLDLDLFTSNWDVINPCFFFGGGLRPTLEDLQSIQPSTLVSIPSPYWFGIALWQTKSFVGAFIFLLVKRKQKRDS